MDIMDNGSYLKMDIMDLISNFSVSNPSQYESLLSRLNIEDIQLALVPLTTLDRLSLSDRCKCWSTAV